MIGFRSKSWTKFSFKSSVWSKFQFFSNHWFASCFEREIISRHWTQPIGIFSSIIF